MIELLIGGALLALFFWVCSWIEKHNELMEKMLIGGLVILAVASMILLAYVLGRMVMHAVQS